jgi:hypothetical protein
MCTRSAVGAPTAADPIAALEASLPPGSVVLRHHNGTPIIGPDGKPRVAHRSSLAPVKEASPPVAAAAAAAAEEQPAPAPAPAGLEEAQQAVLRGQLTELYSTYAPDKLPELDTLIGKYGAAKLHGMVRKKYKVQIR